MWESIKKLFGFGKKEEVVVETPVVKSEPKVAPVAPVVKEETPKASAPKKAKTPKAPKTPKASEPKEVKVTAKDIKANVKKESKPRKPKSKE